MDFSRRRQLAPPLILFYMSAVASIVLSYLFDEHIIAEFAIMRGLEPDLARQEFLKCILKGAAFIVAITVAVMLNRYFTLILLVSFIIGVSGLAEDFAARIVASPNIFDPINGLVFIGRVAYIVAIGRMLYLVFRPQ